MSRNIKSTNNAYKLHSINTNISTTKKKIYVDVPNAIKSSMVVKNVRNGMCAATYRITFVNSYLHSVLPNAKRGAICYESLMGHDTPCEQCPILYLKQDGKTIHRELPIQKLKKYLNIDSVCMTVTGNEAG